MITRLTAAEVVAVKFPEASSTCTIAVPRLLPETIVEERPVIASFAEAPAVTLVVVIAEVSAALLAVIVYIPAVVKCRDVKSSVATPLAAVAVTVCE